MTGDAVMSAAGSGTENVQGMKGRPAGAPRPVRNVVSNWGAFVFGAVVNFSLSPFVVHSLGDVVYGTWVLVGAMVGYLGLLDMGVRGAVTRYVAQMHAGSRHQDAGRIASAALGLFGAGGLIAIAGASVLAVFVGDVFNIPADMIGIARIVLVLGGVNVAVSLLCGVYGGVLIALQRFDLNAGIDITIEALRATAIVTALTLGAGLVGLATVQLAAAVLRGLLQLVISRRLYPDLRVHLRSWGRPELRLIFSFSVYSTFLHIAGMITLQSSSIVIGAVLPVAMITAYAIAANLTSYAQVLGGGVAQTLTPQASALEATGGPAAIRHLPLVAARLSSLVMLPVIVTFMLRGPTFIGLWMGPEYMDTAGPVLLVLSIGLWISAPRYAMSAIVMGIGRHRGLVPAYFGEALFGLSLSVALIGSMGVLGVAWGMTVPNVLVSLLFMPWFLQRIMGVPVRALWLHAWILPVLAMLPFLAASYAVEVTWRADSLAMFFAQVAVALPAAAVGIWFVGMTPTERIEYGPRLRSAALGPAGSFVRWRHRREGRDAAAG